MEHAWKACRGNTHAGSNPVATAMCYDVSMQNFFVGEIVGSLGKSGRNKKWRHFVVVDAPWDLTVDKFNEVVYDLHPEDYLFIGDHGDLEWNDDHSGAKLIKEFRKRGIDLFGVTPADLAYLFPDRNW